MNALFIGRFQPFHNGHLLVIKKIYKKYEKVILGVGSSQYSHTPENPFNFKERKTMIKRSLDQMDIKNYRIVKIPDIHNYSKWVEHVISLYPDFNVVISNNNITRDLFSQKKYIVLTTPLYNREMLSGREIRKRIIQNMPWKSLVPESVYDYINEIDGIKRIKELTNITE